MNKITVDCPLCGTDHYTEIYNDKGRWGYDIRMVVCNDCGMVYQNPMPTAKMLENYYYNVYRASDISVHPQKITREYLDKYSQAQATYIVNALAKYTKLPKTAPILDVGFGIGGVPHRLTQAGYGNITGIDSSITEPQLTSLRKITGGKCQLHKANLHNWRDDRLYKLIILHHVIEHAPSPVGLLSACIRKIEPPGFIFVATPNIFWPRGGWQKFWVMPHVVMFCRQTLAYLWEMFGIEEVASGYYHKAMWSLLWIGGECENVVPPFCFTSLPEKITAWVHNSTGDKRNANMIPKESFNLL